MSSEGSRLARGLATRERNTDQAERQVRVSLGAIELRRGRRGGLAVALLLRRTETWPGPAETPSWPRAAPGVGRTAAPPSAAGRFRRLRRQPGLADEGPDRGRSAYGGK